MASDPLTQEDINSGLNVLKSGGTPDQAHAAAYAGHNTGSLIGSAAGPVGRPSPPSSPPAGGYYVPPDITPGAYGGYSAAASAGDASFNDAALNYPNATIAADLLDELVVVGSVTGGVRGSGTSIAGEEGRVQVTPGARYEIHGSGTSIAGEEGRDQTTVVSNEAQVTPITMKVGEALRLFQQQSVDNPEAYQSTVARLVAAGYLDPKDARFSGYTRAVGDAYVQLLADVDTQNNAALDSQKAGQGGVVKSIDEFLDAQAAEMDADGDGFPDYMNQPSQPQTIVNQFTDPAALRAAVQSQAQSILGRNISDEEADQFVSMFHGLEAQANSQAAAAQADTSGGSFDITQPNPTGQANQFVQNNFEQEAENQAKAKYVGVLQQMVGL